MSRTDAKTILMGAVPLVLVGTGVATDSTGKLDRKFLPKVGDSDLLDGQDSTAFLGVTSKAADADLLDGQDSTAFLEACDEGALWGRATIAGGSVAVGDSPTALNTAGVGNSFFCQRQDVLVRKNSAGTYKVVFGHLISANTIGNSGPPPMVTPCRPAWWPLRPGLSSVRRAARRCSTRSATTSGPRTSPALRSTPASPSPFLHRHHSMNGP